MEWQVNRVQRKKAKLEGRPFVNPHDFGFRRNWEHFLGKHSLPFVLLPSLVAPPPLGEFFPRAARALTTQHNTRTQHTIRAPLTGCDGAQTRARNPTTPECESRKPVRQSDVDSSRTLRQPPPQCSAN